MNIFDFSNCHVEIQGENLQVVQGEDYNPISSETGKKMIDIALEHLQKNSTDELYIRCAKFLTMKYEQDPEFAPEIKNLHFYIENALKSADGLAISQPEEVEEEEHIKILRAEGISIEDINKPIDKKETTPLIDAFHKLYRKKEQNKSKVIDALIKAGADPNLTTREGVSPLMLAALYNDVDRLNALIEVGADKEMTLTSQCALPIIKGKQLLVTAFDKGSSPLIIASRAKNWKIVEILIKQGADPNSVSANGYSSIRCAFESEDPNIIEILIKAGAKISASQALDVNKYLREFLKTGSWTIVKALIEAGADLKLPENSYSINMRDNNITPLLKAVVDGDQTIINLLLDAGADVNKGSTAGHTPLYVAAMYGNVEVVNILIKAGASVDIPDYQGLTPLIIAIIFNREEVEHILRENGADDGYVRKFVEKKFLTNSYGIKNDSVKESFILLNDQKIPFKAEIIHPIFIVPRLMTYALDFFTHDVATESLSESERAQIIDAFKHTYTAPLKKLNLEETQERLDRNLPTTFNPVVIVPEAASSHVINIVLTQDQLIISDRGGCAWNEESRETSRTYSLEPAMLKNLIPLLMEEELQLSKLMSAIKNFSQQIIRVRNQKLQKAMNCQVAQPKAGVLSVCDLIIPEQSRDFYKEFTLIMRLRSLTEYIENTPPNERDQIVLQEVYKKLKNKINNYYFFRYKEPENLKGTLKNLEAKDELTPEEINRVQQIKERISKLKGYYQEKDIKEMVNYLNDTDFRNIESDKILNLSKNMLKGRMLF